MRWMLWQAAGSPGELEHVCPQRFAAPLAPHLAARKEGKQLDPVLLRSGLDYWRERSDFLLVEGAGGLMSPLGDDEYVADLAHDFGFPLVVVAQNQIGVINQTLQTLIVAMTFRDGLGGCGHRAELRRSARRRSQLGDQSRAIGNAIRAAGAGRGEVWPDGIFPTGRLAGGCRERGR